MSRVTQKPTHETVAKAAQDGPGIDAAMRRAVARAIDERRKLGQPVVTAGSIGKNGHVTKPG